MKRKQLYRITVSILTISLTTLIFASQCPASPSPEFLGTKATPAGNQLFTQATHPQPEQEKAQASADELELFRAELIEFVRAYRELAATVSPKQAQNFDGIEEQLLKLSLTELNVIRGGMTDTTILSKATRKMQNSIIKTNTLRASTSSQKDSLITLNSVGFPDADYPSCGPTRTDDSVIDASDTALFVAEGVRDGASRLCGQVAVVAGFGANTSSACIISDGVYLAAKIINYGLHYCNDKIDAAEQSAAYERLTHLHTDLETSIANDTANTSTILAQVNANTATITGAVSASEAAIINNDNVNKALIVSNDNANKVEIIANSDANKTTIVNNDNANTATIANAITAAKIELRDLILRTQIEADLSQNEGNSPVALYETPTANGGYLDLVQTIVTQTLAGIQAAGGGISNAQQFLTKADAAKAAGQFKSAYDLYRKAYKAAAK